ncbi:MAG: hypothetical protein EOO43_13455 [Flavobacterium sp.]|nr:MAG: hypothetical protein EOO43_13455 [Flavobacterium sp.]
MMNIKFSYLYRDAGNYKQHNEEVFSNTYGLSIDEIDKRITLQLIEGEYFSATKWGLPDMHFEDWDQELDLPFHEFLNIELTIESTTQSDIVDFLQKIEVIPQLS